MCFSLQVLPSIANPNTAVRNMAVVCLGTCALHSKDLANRHLVLLLQVHNLHTQSTQPTHSIYTHNLHTHNLHMTLVLLLQVHNLHIQSTQ